MHVHYSILLIHWTFVVEQFPKLLYDLKKRVARKTNLEAGDYRDNRSFVRLDRTNRNIPLGNLTKQVFNEQRSDVISQTCCKKEEEREVKRNKRLNCCRVKVRLNVNGQWNKVISTEKASCFGCEPGNFYKALQGWRWFSRVRVSQRSTNGQHNLP